MYQKKKCNVKENYFIWIKLLVVFLAFNFHSGYCSGTTILPDENGKFRFLCYN